MDRLDTQHHFDVRLVVQRNKGRENVLPPVSNVRCCALTSRFVLYWHSWYADAADGSGT